MMTADNSGSTVLGGWKSEIRSGKFTIIVDYVATFDREYIRLENYGLCFV